MHQNSLRRCTVTKWTGGEISIAMRSLPSAGFEALSAKPGSLLPPSDEKWGRATLITGWGQFARTNSRNFGSLHAEWCGPSVSSGIGTAPVREESRIHNHATHLVETYTIDATGSTSRGMPRSWLARLCGWPASPRARADTGSTLAEEHEALTAVDTYAVAAGANLELAHRAPIRVAIVVEPTPFTHTSGYSTRYKNLIRQLRNAGDEVLVIVPDNDPNAPTEFEGTRIVSIPGFRFPLYRLITLTFGLRGLYSALRDYDPDVIHLTTPGLATYATLLYARLLGKPLMFSYHTHLPIYSRDYGLGVFEGAVWAMLRMQHNGADFTLTTSPQLCMELLQHGVRRVGLWRKGIDPEIFSPRYRDIEMRSRLSKGNVSDPLLIYVGRIGVEKNLTFFKHLMVRLPQCRVAFVGDGPARKQLEGTLDSSRTYFSGILHGEELSKAFASADVFVMPSETETLGFVVLESMASGVPVVGARAGGIPDIIQHEENGFLFEPGNLDECEKSITLLLDDPKYRAVLANQARTESKRWSWAASAAATRNLGYGRAIDNFRRRNPSGHSRDARFYDPELAPSS